MPVYYRGAARDEWPLFLSLCCHFLINYVSLSGLFRKKMEKEGMMVVDIKNIVTRLPELRFTAPVNWRIDEGQQWAVIGPNGAGKTLIADIMQRKFAFKEGEVVFSGDYQEHSV